MKLILTIFAGLVIFSGTSAFADNCATENANNPVPCCTTGHCFRADGCKITPCTGVSTSEDAFSKGAAPTSGGPRAVEGDKATAVAPNSK
jgi:hypothetical protein